MKKRGRHCYTLERHVCGVGPPFSICCFFQLIEELLEKRQENIKVNWQREGEIEIMAGGEGHRKKNPALLFDSVGTPVLHGCVYYLQCFSASAETAFSPVLCIYLLQFPVRRCCLIQLNSNFKCKGCLPRPLSNIFKYRFKYFECSCTASEFILCVFSLLYSRKMVGICQGCTADITLV